MTPELVFNLVFASQIMGLSVVLPPMIRKKIASSAESSVSEAVASRYLLMNNVAVIIGFAVLALLAFHPAFLSIIYTLLAIGTYFFFQLLPIAFSRQLILQPDIAERKVRDSFLLFEAVHPSTIIVACLLFLSYLIASLVVWDGSVNAQLLKVVIFVGANLYLVLMIGKGLHDVGHSSDEQKLERIGHLYRTAPFFIYLSIGISVYYFGKELLFNFDLHEYRPIMMSIFVQLLGLLAFERMSFGAWSKKE